MLKYTEKKNFVIEFTKVTSHLELTTQLTGCPSLQHPILCPCFPKQNLNFLLDVASTFGTLYAGIISFHLKISPAYV